MRVTAEKKEAGLVALQEVLTKFNTKKSFPFKGAKLRKDGVYNAAVIKPWLIAAGYLSKDGSFIEEVNNSNMRAVSESIQEFRKTGIAPKIKTKALPSAVQTLKDVLIDFNRKGVLEFTNPDLVSLKCYYGNSLRAYLIARGYMTNDSKKLKPIVVADMEGLAKDLSNFAAEKVNKRKPKNLKPDPKNVLQGLADKDLADALRARGYKVTAVKTVEVEI